jgi:glucosamine kinase
MERDGGFLLGVDGGGTRCRARLALPSGTVLGEGEAGPANLRLGFIETFAAVLDAAGGCLAAAGLPSAAFGRTIACLALAGASEPAEREAALRHKLPFCNTIITSDADAACVGAHDGANGAVIIVGTGSIGWGLASGTRYRVGGWGLPLSDEGSGAWLGQAALRQVLRAHDGRTAWTPLLAEIFEQFGRNPHAIVRWTAAAKPADYGRFAPAVMAHAKDGDGEAAALARRAAGHIDALAARLTDLGFTRISLAGGLARAIEPYLRAATRRHLVAPAGDALAGAIRIAAAATPARAAAE